MKHPDYEAWLRFEQAIAGEAERLCRDACLDGADCRACGAAGDREWRRDAITSLNAKAAVQTGRVPEEQRLTGGDGKTPTRPGFACPKCGHHHPPDGLCL